MITFSSLYDNDRQYTKKIKEQEDLIDTMSDQLAELKNTVQIKQTIISELKECLLKKDSENEHLKLKIVDFTTVQNLRVQVQELQNDKYCALKEIESLNVEIKSLQTENKVLKSRDSELSNLEKVYETKESVLLKDIDQMKSQVSELWEKLKISDQEMKQQINLLEEDKRMFLAKNEFLEKVSSSVQKLYNDLLASNDVLKQRVATKFMFLKHDTSLEKMFEMIEKEYKSNVSKISMSSSSFESKNLKLVVKQGDGSANDYFEDSLDETSKMILLLSLQVMRMLFTRTVWKNFNVRIDRY
ncbi:hypothetical protein Tco_0737560 [Tanacetum coccineum]